MTFSEMSLQIILLVEPVKIPSVLAAERTREIIAYLADSFPVFNSGLENVPISARTRISRELQVNDPVFSEEIELDLAQTKQLHLPFRVNG